MRSLKMWAALVALLAQTLFVCSCTQPTSSQQASERKGIISLAPHITETVFALGQGNRVIAVSDFCDYPSEAANLPRAGGYINPDLEKIAMLKPELVIVQGKHQAVADFGTMNKINILNVDMDSLDGIDSGIAEIGKALGCETKATELREKNRKELDSVSEAVKDRPRPKVLAITMRQNHDLNSLYTANYESFVSELVEVAGGANVFASADTTYLEASKESVVLRAPDVIVEFHAGETLDDAEKEKYKEDWSELSSIPAVKRGRIFLITESYALRPGPRVGEIARILARCIHPEVDIPSP